MITVDLHTIADNSGEPATKKIEISFTWEGQDEPCVIGYWRGDLVMNLLLAAQQALMAIDEGYDAPIVTSSLRGAIALFGVVSENV